MAKVSITQAAKLAGISRSNLYKSYIDKGLITVSKDDRNKSCIDTSELLRVFSVLQGDSKKGDDLTQLSTPKKNNKKADKAKIIALEDQIEQLKLQLSKSEEREGWYQSQIQSLTDTMKLLEGPKKLTPWWKFWK